MTIAATTARPAPRRLTRPISPWWASLVAGLLALSGTGSATLNGDELATLSAAARSIDGLFELSQNIDGHFLPYYLFMHFWVKAGTAELWLRLPSAIAIAVAAGFLGDLGRRLHSARAGLTAGVLLAVLPSVSYYGAFARPYAFAAAAVVVSFWALHRAKESDRWVLYGVTVALVGCTHLFAVLVLPAHLVVGRLRALPALAAGCVPAAALAILGYGERHAISWIPQKGPDVLLKFPKMAAGDMGVGLLLFAAAIAGVVLLVKRDSEWAGALLGWLVLPPLLLLAVSHLVTPVYVDRYLFVTAPALALGAALLVADRLWAAIALPVVAAAIAVPAHLDVRESNGRFEDFPAAIAKITYRHGDAILYGQSPLRAGFEYYAPGKLPDDVLRLSSSPSPTGFGFPESTDVLTAIDARKRLWVVWRGARTAGPSLPVYKAATEAGFAPARTWHSADLPGLTVSLLIRP
ncbi:glycosyltransferase family 39 protein [Nonomuraea sp. NPDC050556]|uniref:glycosyltransferase family 39 protein n=1 Tax=Nonomuraea sp. NPDC050556 TaxID=3364369 RepID=UPI00379BB811